MAAATEAQLKTELTKLSQPYKDALDYAALLVPAIEDVRANVRSDAAAQMLGQMDGIRAALNGLLSASGPLESNIWGWARLAGNVSRAANVQGAFNRVFAYMASQGTPITVLSRGITQPAPTLAGGNTGSGQFLRHTVDAWGYARENVFLDLTTARCLRDANGGARRNAEEWQLRGGWAVDAVELLGSGRESALIPSANEQTAGLRNLGFDIFSGDAAATPTGIPGWSSTGTATTDYIFETTPIFLPLERSTQVRHSILLKSAQTLTKRLDDDEFRADQFAPYFGACRYKRVSGSGDLIFTVGGKSNSVTLAAGTSWGELNFLPTPNHEDAYYSAWGQDELSMTIECDGTLVVNVDDVVLTPYKPWGGTFVLPIAGATPWLGGSWSNDDGDTATWLNALAGSDSYVQQLAFRLMGRYFPHVAAANVIAEPT